MRATTIPATPAHCRIRSRIGNASIHYCMVLPGLVAPVNTAVYGALSQGTDMTDQLSAKDWLDQGLKTLAQNRLTALKAAPVGQATGVSRAGFYWHFAQIGAS